MNPQGVVVPQDVFRVLATFAGAGAVAMLALLCAVGLLVWLLMRKRRSEDFNDRVW